MIIGHEYIFSYMTNKMSLTYDGVNCLAKMGPFRKKTFAFNSIQYWYVLEDKNYRQMYITYTDESGKTKKVQLMAHLGEPGFRDLAEALNHAIPNKGLNHLSEKEAFKTMGTMNPKKLGIVIAMGVIFTLTTVFMFPGLCHFFDFGFEEASVEQLIAGENGSRNLRLTGNALDDYTIEETTTTTRSGSSSTTVEVFTPMVSYDWDGSEPVMCVLKFDDEEYYGAMSDNEFTGVVRDIWYEGLDSDEIEFFMTEYGLEVSDDAILFEVTGEEHNDSLMFFLWLGLNGLFGIIFFIAYLKQK